MTELNDKSTESTGREASELDVLVSSLRIKAGMINNCVKIAWGSETELMMKAAYALENAMPAFDLLQSRLENGARIEKQEFNWWLFDNNGEGICFGATIREMMLNLIFTDC